MGSVGLLFIYHIFDVIRERIAHMDDGEKDWAENWEAQEACRQLEAQESTTHQYVAKTTNKYTNITMY